MTLEREPWLQYGGPYRNIQDFSIPWVPSPVIPPLPDIQAESSSSYRSGHPQHTPSADGPCVSTKRQGRSRWKKIRSKNWGPLKKIFPGRQHEDSEDSEDLPERVGNHEWKAWGYYVRPKIDGEYHRNSPHLRQNSDGQFEEDSPALHPALPPRPKRFNRLPRPNDPITPPSNCQLCPFLRHEKIGPGPIFWQMMFSPTSILYGGCSVAIPLSDADMMQPATHPLVRKMYINAIADDRATHLPWPIKVENSEGSEYVHCLDVFNAVYKNFQEFISRQELDSWDPIRKEQAAWSFNKRRTDQARMGVELDEWSKRIDYLGFRYMFRGLEPNPSGEGWILFVGS